MAKRSGNRLLQSDAASAGRAQARQADVWKEREQARRGVLPLASIQPRPGGDSRYLKASHILNLAESIDAVGLVEPPTVDLAGHLLAGAHRIAALKLLAQTDCESRIEMWLKITGSDKSRLSERQQMEIERLRSLHPLGSEEVPVMILPFNALDDPSLALAVETSENTQRKSYSKQEIFTLVQRLREAGFVEREGRPRVGEKALRPALSIVIGKSANTVRRWLGVLDDRQKTCPNGQVLKRWQVEQKLLTTIRYYQQILLEDSTSMDKELLNCLSNLECLLEKISLNQQPNS
jgi:ParB family chromosome partitioning protein